MTHSLKKYYQPLTQFVSGKRHLGFFLLKSLTKELKKQKRELAEFDRAFAEKIKILNNF